MAKRNKEYYVRKFLNKDSGLAAILISGSQPSRGFTVTISDCSRNITLDFETYGYLVGEPDYIKHRDNLRKKINLLISELERARDWSFSANETEE